MAQASSPKMPLRSRLGLIGATGRMGQAVLQVLTHHSTLQQGLVCSSRQGCVQQVFSDSACVLDFSSATSLRSMHQAWCANPRPIVLCATNWDRTEGLPWVKEWARHVPVVWTSNTSIGACLQRKIAQQITQWLSHCTGNEIWDVDITERHHRHKKDAPSGTARALLQAVTQPNSPENSAEPMAIWDPAQGPRPLGSVGLQIQRSGGILGEHDVTWTHGYEMLQIRHVILGRTVFAQGALQAAAWTLNQPPGLYTMEHVLGLA